jgi:hypothetical protein
LIKQGGKEIKKVIYELISKMWEEEIIPHEWKYVQFIRKGAWGCMIMTEQSHSYVQQ